MNEVIRKEFGQQLGAKCGIEACINDKAPQAFTAATIQAIIGAVYRDCGGEMKTLSNVARALGLLPKKCEGANPAPVFKFQGQKDANSKKTTPHATAISQKATLTQEPVNVPQPAPVKASAAVQRSPAVNAPSNVHPMITRSKAVARKESLTVQGLMTENEALLVLSLKANKEAATVKESSAVKKATALQKAPAVEESSTLQKATLGRKSLAQRVATLQRAAFVEKSLAALKTMSIQGDPRFKKGTAPKKSNCLQSPPTSSISSSPRSSSPAFSNATSGGVRLNTQSFWVAQKPVFKSSTAIVGTVTAADGGSWW